MPYALNDKIRELTPYEPISGAFQIRLDANESYLSLPEPVLAETCVFAKQSPGPILCGHIAVAPLFPKLRGQFAEFLNYPSPVGLRILFLSTCVGLRYGHLKYTQDFSRPSPRILPYSNFSPLRPGQPTPGLCSFWVSSCLNLSVATEFLPYVHRLRLSASP